eukprot:scaffold69_cov248-Pinguiococcus_pyrenoidosus.AAC.13
MADSVTVASSFDDWAFLAVQSERESDARVWLKQLSCLLTPVTILGILVVLINYGLGLRPEGSDPFRRILPGSGFQGPFLAAVIAEALENWGFTADAAFCSAVLCGVIFVTVAFALAFKYRWGAGLYALLGWCTASAVGIFVGTLLLLFFPLLQEMGMMTPRRSVETTWSLKRSWPSGWTLQRIAETSRAWALDWFLLLFLSSNAGAVIAASVLALHEEAPQVGNTALIVVSVCVAWIVLCFDGYTLVAVLIALVAWDLYAVLGPGGPIKAVLHLALHYKYMAIDFKMPPGISYTAEYYSLGTGDLVFYGVLIGRAYFSGLASAVFALVGVQLGVLGTVYATTVGPHGTLPALPLSLTLGGLLWAVGYYAIDRGGPTESTFQDGFEQTIYF